jgi:hypothetical protein
VRKRKNSREASRIVFIVPLGFAGVPLKTISDYPVIPNQVLANQPGTVGEFELRTTARQEEIHSLTYTSAITAPWPDKCEIMIGDITI